MIIAATSEGWNLSPSVEKLIFILVILLSVALSFFVYPYHERARKTCRQQYREQGDKQGGF